MKHLLEIEIEDETLEGLSEALRAIANDVLLGFTHGGIVNGQWSIQEREGDNDNII